MMKKPGTTIWEELQQVWIFHANHFPSLDSTGSEKRQEMKTLIGIILPCFIVCDISVCPYVYKCFAFSLPLFAIMLEHGRIIQITSQKINDSMSSIWFQKRYRN